MKKLLVRTAIFSGLQVVVKILLGFFIVRLLSYNYGPDGLAVFGLFQNVLSIAYAACGGLFATYITKYVAENSDNSESILNLTNFIVIYVIFTLPLIVFCDWLVGYVNIKDKDGFDFGIILVFFGTLSYAVVNITIAYLGGLYKQKSILLISTASMLISAILIYLFKNDSLYTELCMYIAGNIIVGCIILLIVKDHLVASFRNSLQRLNGFNDKLEGFIYCIIGAISMIALPLTQIAIREIITTDSSLESAGLWQGVSKLSDVYLSVITVSISSYYVPAISKAIEKVDQENVLRSMIQFSMPVVVVTLLFVYILRNHIVSIALGPQFQEVDTLIIYQIPGDVLKILSWLFAFLYLIKGNKRIFVALEIIFSFTYVIFSNVFVQYCGLKGAILAYSFNYLLYTIVIIALVKKTVLNHRITTVNV